MDAATAQRCLDAGADFVLIGRGAMLHHDFARRALADPAFRCIERPVSRAHLEAEGLGPAVHPVREQHLAALRGRSLNTTAASARRALWSGTLAYLASCLLFGLNLPLSAELLKHFDPFWVSPLRYLVSAVMLGGMLLVSVGPRQLRSPIPLWRVAVLSLCVAAFLVLYNLGLYRSGPLTVAAISAGSPVYVAVVSRLMTGARLERGFWGATVLTLVGAGIAISGRAARRHARRRRRWPSACRAARSWWCWASAAGRPIRSWRSAGSSPARRSCAAPS